MLGGLPRRSAAGVELGEQLQAPRVQQRGAARDDRAHQPFLAPEVVLRGGGVAGGGRLSHLAKRNRLDAALGEEPLRDDDQLLGRRPTIGAPRRLGVGHAARPWMTA